MDKKTPSTRKRTTTAKATTATKPAKSAAAAPRTRKPAAPKAIVTPLVREGWNPSHEDIALRAHVLYEQSGWQPGREQEFWFEAERQLRDEALERIA